MGKFRNSRVVTANYTALSYDNVILCDSSGGEFTVTLPHATSGNILTGHKITIIGVDINDNNVIVSTAAGDGSTLNGTDKQRLHGDGNVLILQLLENNVWAQLSPQPVVTTTITLTTAQVTGMFATPQTIIPGIADTIVVVTDVTLALDAGASAFAAGGDLLIQTDAGEDVTSANVTAAFIQSASDKVYVAGSTSNYYEYTPGEDITISNDTGAFTTGDGELHVTVTYRIIPTRL